VVAFASSPGSVNAFLTSGATFVPVAIRRRKRSLLNGGFGPRIDDIDSQSLKIAGITGHERKTVNGSRRSDEGAPQGRGLGTNAAAQYAPVQTGSYLLGPFA
jgi:hypothetical protein